MGTVKGVSWLDLSPNSEFNDPPETTVEGVKVTLYDANTNTKTSYTGITDKNGEFVITEVNVGRYYAMYEVPKGYGFQTLQGFVDENGKGKAFTLVSGGTYRDFAPLKGVPYINLNKIVDLSIANIGEELTYTINVSNNGFARANNIKVMDIIASGTTFVNNSVMVDGQPRLGDNPTVGIVLGNIEANSVKTITFKVKVNENLTDGTIIKNRATVNFNGRIETSNEATITVKISFISGVVWNDLNGDGIKSENEPALRDITVELYSSNNLSTIIKSIKTDDNGRYTFDKLKSGEYIVKFTRDKNWIFTDKNIGNNKLINSKVNIESGFTDIITLRSGGNDSTVNSGLIKLVTIRGKAFLDSNKNGLLNNGEIGISNVTLTLFQCNTTNVTRFKATTNSSGEFIVRRVKPGFYHGVFTKPNGYDFVTIGAKIDAMGKTPCFTVESGINITDFNVPLINIIDVIASKEVNTREAEVGDILTYTIKVFNFGVLPINNVNVSDVLPLSLIFINNSLKINGKVQRGVNPNSGINLGVISSGISTTIEFQTKVEDNLSIPDKIINRAKVEFDKSSIYTNIMEVEIKKSSIKGLVWEDLNGDGIRNDNEPVLSNIKVNIYEYDNLDDFIKTTITNSRGEYVFNNLKSDKYIVEFTKPKRSIFTKKNIRSSQVNIEKDSDVNPESGRTSEITLNIEENINNVDAGIIKELTIKGVVWEDSNENKKIDRGELGVKEVKVGVFDCNDGESTEYNAITNENGEYEINFFEPGNYYLVFFKAENYEFLETDNIDDITGETECFEIKSSQNKVLNVALKKTKEVECISCISGVIMDKCTKCGVSDVRVYLIAPNKKILKTETNCSGKYYFKVNLPGIYEVRFGQVCGCYITPRKLQVKVNCLQCVCHVNALVYLK